jgi:2-C-methyl-D-erythritol 4-phosphate cytidylyltransferase
MASQGEGSLGGVRAMIVVAAGTGNRFTGDKMMATVDGRPLVALTVARVRDHVDRCVVVCREEQLEALSRLDLGVDLTVGGPTRTASEIAGLAALTEEPDLIGIHDGARPNPGPRLVERLFEEAARVGGAVPVVPAPALVLDRETLQPVPGLMAAQTPQVFEGPALIRSYREAEAAGYSGQDTLDVVSRFASVPVVAVPGEATNLKVTFPEDLEKVRVD